MPQAFPRDAMKHPIGTCAASFSRQPGIDELEVFGPHGEVNLVLAENGAIASASSCLAGYPIHQIAHLNDGRYGNEKSWIAAGSRDEWIQIELAAPAEPD